MGREKINKLQETKFVPLSIDPGLYQKADEVLRPHKLSFSRYVNKLIVQDLNDPSTLERQLLPNGAASLPPANKSKNTP
jgi:hypothetical protein